MAKNKKASFNQAKFDVAQRKYQAYLAARGVLCASAPSIDIARLKEIAQIYKDGGHASVLETTNPEIMALRNTFGTAEMVRRMELAVAKDAFRPRNMRIFDFVASPDLDYVGDAFSTFDAKLSRAMKQEKNKDILRRRNAASVTNVDEVKQQYKNDWMAVLKSHPRYVRQVIDNAHEMDADRLSDIFQILADDVLRRMGIEYEWLYVYVVDDWQDAPQGLVPPDILNARAKIGGFYIPFKTVDSPLEKNAIVLNRSVHPRGNNFDLFIKLIDSLSHEFGHFIDDMFPQYGMLGAQINNIGSRIHQTGTEEGKQDLYHDNATEKSSFAIGRAVTDAVRQKYGR